METQSQNNETQMTDQSSKRGWNRQHARNHTLLHRSKHQNRRLNIFGKVLHHRTRKSKGYPRTSLAQETQSRNKLGKRHSNLEKFGAIKEFGKTMATKKGTYQKGTTTEYERRRRLRSDKKLFFKSLIRHGHDLTRTLGHGG